MEGFLSALIYLFVFIAIIARVKKKKSDNALRSAKNESRKVNIPSNDIAKPGNSSSKYGQESVIGTYKKNKSTGVNKHMAKEKTNIRAWEDRRGDWLARQMEDERQAQRRMSEMFQLKMEHRYNCEAEMLKQFHESHCDADDVDTAKA